MKREAFVLTRLRVVTEISDNNQWTIKVFLGDGERVLMMDEGTITEENKEKVYRYHDLFIENLMDA